MECPFEHTNVIKIDGCLRFVADEFAAICIESDSWLTDKKKLWIAIFGTIPIENQDCRVVATIFLLLSHLFIVSKVFCNHVGHSSVVLLDHQHLPLQWCVSAGVNQAMARKSGAHVYTLASSGIFTPLGAWLTGCGVARRVRLPQATWHSIRVAKSKTRFFRHGSQCAGPRSH